MRAAARCDHPRGQSSVGVLALAAPVVEPVVERLAEGDALLVVGPPPALAGVPPVTGLVGPVPALDHPVRGDPGNLAVPPPVIECLALAGASALLATAGDGGGGAEGETEDDEEREDALGLHD